MKNGLPFGAIAACLAGLCACTPSPPTPAHTASTASHAAEPSATAPAEPAAPPAGTTPSADAASPAAAEAVVRAYYAAIDARDFATAYAQWSDGGAASGQSFEHFRDGYASTASVRAEIGKATDEEGAAGSRYIRVPMELRATQHDGSVRHYRGGFILRAAMADGASAEQRRWHLYSADIQRLPE